MNKEKEIKYSKWTDRQLLLYLVEKINKIEEETEHEKARLMIEESGLGILNGKMASVEKGEWTFIGKMGSSVVYYAITEVETWEKINEFKV